MASLNARERGLAAAALASACALVLLQGAVLPLVSRWRDFQQEAASAEARVEKAGRLIANASLIEAAHRRLALSVPGRSEQEEMGAFLQEVETLARRNLLSISDLRPLPSADRKTHRLYSVQFETRGDPARLASFLYVAEIVTPAWRVERFSASSVPDGVLAKLEISKAVIGAPPRPGK